MSARIFYLWYSRQDGRYQRHDYGLHCGNCLVAMINGAWVETRIEHSSSSEHSHGTARQFIELCSAIQDS